MTRELFSKTQIALDARSAGLESKPAEDDASPQKFRGANLCGADLRNASLSQLDFSGATMAGANLAGVQAERTRFDGANLTDADFTGADCREAHFGVDDSKLPADLTRAVLRDADLTRADLSQSVGLTARSFGGAVLLGARLPQDLASFEGLNQTAEISRNSSKVFFLIQSACLYCWLTIATTSDVDLIVDSSKIALPVIGTPIQAAGFYYAAPMLLAFLYLYFVLYLQRLWHELSVLPAVFPDGSALDERAYPWLLNGLVRSEFARLSLRDRPLALAESQVAFLTTWLLVPFTVGGFWLRYLPRHDWWGTAWHVALLSAVSLVGLSARALAIRTLRGGSRPTAARSKGFVAPFRYMGFLKRQLHTAIGVATVVMVIGLTVAAAKWPGHDPLSRFVVRTTVHLREADLSSKLPAWKEGALDNVRGIDLRGWDLRGANMSNAFLAKALLDDANLDGADLTGATLTNASLKNASARGAIFDGADLTGEANLFSIRAERASFKGAQLTSANLHFAEVCGAIFDDANLSDSDLADTNAASASFIDTSLNNTSLSSASLVDANLDGDTDMTDTKLDGADLCGAQLKGGSIGACRPGRTRHRPSGANAWPHACIDPNANAIVPD